MSRRLAATLVACGLLAGFPAASSAACGGVEQERPRADHNLGRAPIAIGDSALLGALPQVASAGIRANARGCRQYPEALALMRDLRSHDRLPRLVILEIGSNGVVSKDNVHDALDIVGKKGIVALVTPREAAGVGTHDIDLIRKEAHAHKRIRLLDWVRYSAGHSAWFQPDGLHLTLDGAEAMARLFSRVFEWLPNPR
jgi:lysophospholipase L1-like esterase